MAYLILLTFFTFLLAFAVKLLITYFFIKFFNRTAGFWAIFKPILLYELGVFCFFFINPVSLIYLLTPIIPRVFLFPVYLLISVVILFLIFKFVMQKFSLLNLKKSLLIFFVMFLIITPIISYSRTMLEFNIGKNLPVYKEMVSIQEIFQQKLFQSIKSPAGIILDKVNKLNDIFLGDEFLKGLRNFLITWPF